ncbi:putative methylaconitate Delta-isomerase PrpF [Allostella vacuolata]|nr:putative methylaconitate Delta-isomerase PrpF [Stella vacuolata]
MGGGISSLSKVVMIGPPTREDTDVDYTFGQVAVDRPVVDWGANCGNLSSAVGPFAIDEGLVPGPDGERLVRIHQTNTRKVIHARFQVRDGKAVTAGDFAIAGVAGTGARIRLDFLDPGGSVTAGLLPTGNPMDRLALPGRPPVTVSLVDATNPVVFVAAADIGLTGTELPDAIEARPEVMALLDRLRRHAGVLAGLGGTPGAVPLANPKVAVVAPPAPFRTLDKRRIGPGDHDVGVRMLSMERAHRAVTLTGAMCLGVAAGIEGTVVQRLARAPSSDGELRVGNPSGVISVGSTVRFDGRWIADSAVVFRTARRLMQGSVAAS